MSPRKILAALPTLATLMLTIAVIACATQGQVTQTYEPIRTQALTYTPTPIPAFTSRATLPMGQPTPIPADGILLPSDFIGMEIESFTYFSSGGLFTSSRAPITILTNKTSHRQRWPSGRVYGVTERCQIAPVSRVIAKPQSSASELDSVTHIIDIPHDATAIGELRFSGSEQHWCDFANYMRDEWTDHSQKGAPIIIGNPIICKSRGEYSYKTAKSSTYHWTNCSVVPN